MDDGEDDFVFFGSALERVDELSKRKQRLAVAEGRAKQLPVWKQEVTTSSRGRRLLVGCSGMMHAAVACFVVSFDCDSGVCAESLSCFRDSQP